MTYSPGAPGNGAHSDAAEGPGLGQRVDHLGASAQQLWSEARGAVTDLNETLDLKGRVQRNPYGMVIAAVGVGYLLGGGLFTSLTARLVSMGVRLAALPLVKDELINMAQNAFDGYQAGAGRTSSGKDPDAV